MGDTNLDSLVLDSGGLSITTGSSGITLNGVTITVVGEASETYDAGSIDDGNEGSRRIDGDWCRAWRRLFWLAIRLMWPTSRLPLP